MPFYRKMKGSGPLLAYILAASTVALTSSSSARDEGMSQGFSSSGKNRRSSNCTSANKEKFEPRFDGLRFIETLVTAHR
ncbi:putative Phospho-N-acetylmuramoyl-pentapeptide-transferase [Melia azedarach]|uniref:Phospho-N-acetylmuramoyl-pentapeptide-transferase n=1 Tax=Melia azedarach TaxID=155640 RepID=A0ACC1XKV6_MELAZ|nr:putative Phospho-N-acetylmuramoyl-pentapeptide-transferase [Melia azedarach]